MIEQARRPKAADIPDARVLAIVRRLAPGDLDHTTRWDIAEQLPDMPFKVVSAKINALARRGLLAGCSSCHDCRGDFKVAEGQ